MDTTVRLNFYLQDGVVSPRLKGGMFNHAVHALYVE